jgi:hypothetical protein
MITVKVTYRVRAVFANKNKENIGRFMIDLSEIPGNKFRYNVYSIGDGQTFVHLSHFADEAIQQVVLNMPSFKRFQEQRDASDLEMMPTIETMNFIAGNMPPI